MKHKKTLPILLAEDLPNSPDQENRAIAVRHCASDFGQRLMTTVDVVHVESHYLEPFEFPEHQQMTRDYFSDQKSFLKKSARSIKVPTRVVMLQGDPVHKLTALTASKKKYEMIIQGTQGRKGLARIVLGSVAEEMIRNSMIPVMTVGPKAQNLPRYLPVNPAETTIMVPTCLSSASKSAETYATRLAQKLGAKVILVHGMIESLHPILQTSFQLQSLSPAMLELFAEKKTLAQQQLDAIAKKMEKKGIQVTAYLDSKNPSASDIILREANKHTASIIVVGTHGRTLAGGAFFGRTARDVILKAEVPVVTVRTTEKKSFQKT